MQMKVYSIFWFMRVNKLLCTLVAHISKALGNIGRRTMKYFYWRVADLRAERLAVPGHVRPPSCWQEEGGEAGGSISLTMLLLSVATDVVSVIRRLPSPPPCRLFLSVGNFVVHSPGSEVKWHRRLWPRAASILCIWFCSPLIFVSTKRQLKRKSNRQSSGALRYLSFSFNV